MNNAINTNSEQQLMKDYEGIRELANDIKTISEEVYGIFNVFDNIMKTSNTETWIGQGSNQVFDWYSDETASQYAGFREKIVEYADTIIAETYSTEAQDAAESSKIIQAG